MIPIKAIHLRIEHSKPWQEDHFKTIRQNWFREIEVLDKITLEELSAYLLEILRWDSGHLFDFKIKNRTYSHYGSDDFVVEDFCGGGFLC